MYETETPKKKKSKHYRIRDYQRVSLIVSVLVGASALGILVLWGFTWEHPTDFQLGVARFVAAVTCALLAYFFTGGITLKWEPFRGLAVSATSGSALFVLVALVPATNIFQVGPTNVIVEGQLTNNLGSRFEGLRFQWSNAVNATTGRFSMAFPFADAEIPLDLEGGSFNPVTVVFLVDTHKNYVKLRLPAVGEDWKTGEGTFHIDRGRVDVGNILRSVSGRVFNLTLASPVSVAIPLSRGIPDTSKFQRIGTPPGVGGP